MPSIKETLDYQEIRDVLGVMFIRYCMWLAICQMPGKTGLVLSVPCVYITFFFRYLSSCV